MSNSSNVIEEIKNRLNIVDVISEYVGDVRNSGKNIFALCPFHSEKSPSFSINPEIQRYKCFGCGEAGDVITFIQKIEGLDFPRALEFCAKKAGVELDTSKYGGKKEDFSKIYEANFLVAKFFNYLLTKHNAGKDGLQYAKQRGFNTQIINKFLIGFAPEGFNNLKNFLKKRGYSEQDAENYGLLASKNNRTYDKFRKRLMFPIFNHYGDVVGFSGRVIDNEDIPKYLNSPQTNAYNKSKVLYGLYQAKEAIRKKGYVIVVEGNVDVPMAHQFGVENIVAPMGTALTIDQLKLLKRYTKKIYFAFDKDNAGFKALRRSFELAESLEMVSFVIDLGEYKDVDEILTNASASFFERLDNSGPAARFILDELIKQGDLETPYGKSKLLDECITVLRQIKDLVVRDEYTKEISDRLDIDFKRIAEKLREGASTKRSYGNQANTLQNKNSEEEKEANSPAPKPVPVFKLSEKVKTLLAFKLAYSKEIGEIDYEKLLKDREFANVFENFFKAENKREFLEKAEQKYKKSLEDIEFIDISAFNQHNIKREFDKLYRNVLVGKYKDKLKRLRKALKQSGDENLVKEMNEVLTQLKSLNV